MGRTHTCLAEAYSRSESVECDLDLYDCDVVLAYDTLS